MATKLLNFGDSLSETSDPNVCQKVRPKFGRSSAEVQRNRNFGQTEINFWPIPIDRYLIVVHR